MLSFFKLEQLVEGNAPQTIVNRSPDPNEKRAYEVGPGRKAISKQLSDPGAMNLNDKGYASNYDAPDAMPHAVHDLPSRLSQRNDGEIARVIWHIIAQHPDRYPTQQEFHIEDLVSKLKADGYRDPQGHNYNLATSNEDQIVHALDLLSKLEPPLFHISERGNDVYFSVIPPKVNPKVLAAKPQAVAQAIADPDEDKKVVGFQPRAPKPIPQMKQADPNNMKFALAGELSAALKGFKDFYPTAMETGMTAPLRQMATKLADVIDKARTSIDASPELVKRLENLKFQLAEKLQNYDMRHKYDPLKMDDRFKDVV